MDVLLRDDGFWVAFTVAALAVVVSVVSTRRLGTRSSFAIVITVAFCYASAVDDDLTFGLVFGVLAIVAAGYVRERTDRWLEPALLLAVGGWFVVVAPPEAAGWMRVLGFLVILVAVAAARITEARAPRVLPLLVLVSAVGVWACVPDTELPRMLLGAALPAALLALDPAETASPWTGVVMALVVYTVLVGGEARPGAIIGGLACVGVILVVPVAAWVADGRRNAAVLVVTHAALVLWVARLAGLQESGWVAFLLCAPAFGVAWVVLRVSARAAARRGAST